MRYRVLSGSDAGVGTGGLNIRLGRGNDHGPEIFRTVNNSYNIGY